MSAKTFLLSRGYSIPQDNAGMRRQVPYVFTLKSG